MTPTYAITATGLRKAYGGSVVLDGVNLVDVPAELVATLGSDDAAEAAYRALSSTHRKEYARWVGEAKRAETRHARAEKAVDMLNRGIRTPD